MTALQILVKVRDEILTGPEKWCKASTIDVDARATCLLLAVHHTNRPGNDADEALAALRKHCGGNSVIRFNDAPETTFADIRRVLSSAISDLEKEAHA